eukprot:GHVS01036320.1.p1 GENE.GHVS01036320.1~~GHVS01036320.1.p1  ORF type:complete len:287 (+),score=21.36 GHVS01036320.1:626-1486(+)
MWPGRSKTNAAEVRWREKSGARNRNRGSGGSKRYQVDGKRKDRGCGIFGCDKIRKTYHPSWEYIRCEVWDAFRISLEKHTRTRMYVMRPHQPTSARRERLLPARRKRCPHLHDQPRRSCCTPEGSREALEALLHEYADTWYGHETPGMCKGGEAQLVVTGRPHKAKPLPLLWEVLRFAGSQKYLFTFDLLQGFWHLPLSFGLKTAPSEFQRAIDHSLKDPNGKDPFLLGRVPSRPLASEKLAAVASLLKKERHFEWTPAWNVEEGRHRDRRLRCRARSSPEGGSGR